MAIVVKSHTRAGHKVRGYTRGGGSSGKGKPAKTGASGGVGARAAKGGTAGVDARRSAKAAFGGGKRGAASSRPIGRVNRENKMSYADRMTKAGKMEVSMSGGKMGGRGAKMWRRTAKTRGVNVPVFSKRNDPFR